MCYSSTIHFSGRSIHSAEVSVLPVEMLCSECKSKAEKQIKRKKENCARELFESSTTKEEICSFPRPRHYEPSGSVTSVAAEFFFFGKITSQHDDVECERENEK